LAISDIVPIRVSSTIIASIARGYCVRYSFTVVVLCLVLALACDNGSSPVEPSAEPANAGSIVGTVEFEPGEFDNWARPMVFLAGVGSFTVVDSNGYFEFQFVKPGTYTLVYDYYSWMDGNLDSSTVTVTVDSGEVTDVGTIRLTLSSGSYYNDDYDGFEASFRVDGLYSLNSQNFSYRYRAYSMPHPDTLYVTADSLYFTLRGYYSDSGSYETTYEMQIDSQTVAAGMTHKLRASFWVKPPSGVHLFTLLRDGNVVAVRYIYNLRGITPCMKVEASGESGSADLDLYLVNSAGDTCSYRDMQPDWGTAGTSGDDPQHSGDMEIHENILYPKVADGNYAIFVHNYTDTAMTSTAYWDTATVSVRVTIDAALDTTLRIPALLPGHIWAVGRVTMPGATFVADGTTRLVWYP